MTSRCDIPDAVCIGKLTIVSQSVSGKPSHANSPQAGELLGTFLEEVQPVLNLRDALRFEVLKGKPSDDIDSWKQIDAAVKPAGMHGRARM